ncbi:Molybdopterin-synthase sulfurtransferase [Gigaspora rosea]|uniref:Needs CLA4 to survive protein 3 n=1 Tax=Gigaspora rosea TaxID=44941 RepID=A0A397VLK8_9GLOM|nr:Molybdopterin-synthase sulfurtransferase [Gigaspora rosea]
MIPSQTDKNEYEKLFELCSKLRDENEQLKNRVKQLESQLICLHSLTKVNSKPINVHSDLNVKSETTSKLRNDNKLSLEEYLRYGRQLILPGFGISGQLKIKNKSILIVGAGGLGAPAAIYLAAAGVGNLGIIDYDSVESSNLQRQIIHNESRIGLSKAQSAKMTIQGLNPLCECVAYDLLLDSSNALDIIKKYDIVVDATDNAATRYLINDACVLTGKPLVSGSALRMDGQLAVYNYRGGPCYRCIFSKPPPPETILNCDDGGVLGVVTGVIGCLQALQAIKIAADMNDDGISQSLLIFSANSNPLFRSIKLRSKKPDCVICSNNPTITTLQDYVQFCGSGALDKSPSVKLLGDDERVDPKSYHALRAKGIPHILVDVREPVQFDICNLPGSLNIPLNELSKKVDLIQQSLPSSVAPVYVICRRGNDSQLAVQTLRKTLQGEIKDVVGGLYRWAKDVDHEFPIY